MDYRDRIRYWRDAVDNPTETVIVRSDPHRWVHAFDSEVEIARSTDGRTVTGYAAIFNASYPVEDQYGQYHEVIHRSAFDKVLATGKLPAVLWNHGRSLSGEAHPLAEVPLGRALEVRADGKGLLTRARYNKTELADSILEAIRAGDITSQSFRGRIIRSTPDRVPRVRHGEPWPTITRQELGLTDFGPCLSPVNADARILAVRGRPTPRVTSQAQIREKIRRVTAGW